MFTYKQSICTCADLIYAIMLTINYEHFSHLVKKLEKMEEEDDFTIDCTQEEVEALTEKLLDNDENNCARFFRY